MQSTTALAWTTCEAVGTGGRRSHVLERDFGTIYIREYRGWQQSNCCASGSVMIITAAENRPDSTK